MPRYGSVCMMLVLVAVLPASVSNAEEDFAVVPMARGNHLHLFAPVSVNGSKIMWFLVDTGFPRSLISPELGRGLPAPLHKWGGLIGADLLFTRHAIIDLGNRGLYLMADTK
jgi:hypothetical protein